MYIFKCTKARVNRGRERERERREEEKRQETRMHATIDTSYRGEYRVS